MPKLTLAHLLPTIPTVSMVVLSCLLSSAVHAEEEAAPAKPIAKEAAPEKMKALEADSLPKPKSKPSSSAAEANPKEEMSPDELAAKIAKKMADLHLENEKTKAQIQARRAESRRIANAAALAKVAREPKPAEEVAPINLRNVHWGYDGNGSPQNWAKLDPLNAKCETGDRQSPINITEGIQVDLEPVTFDYKPVRYNIVDTGQTIQVNVGQGDSIFILGRRYDLVEFHFHKPAEERINGKTYDMSAHLVHKSVDGKLVEIAVLFEEGKGNNLIQTIWNNMPLEKNMFVQPTGTIDMNQILPTGRQYYTYMGSITTPPCTEGVLWVVYKEPVQLTIDQIGIFNRMYPMNARPIQNAAGRLIKESN